MLGAEHPTFIYFPNIASKSDDQQGKWDLPDWSDGINVVIKC